MFCSHDRKATIKNLENAGAIAGLNRQISQLHQQKATLNTQADALLLLNPPREDLAATVEQRLQEVESRLTRLNNNQLEKAQAIQAQYERAMSALEAKHTAMMRQLRTLQSMDTSASAEERAAHATSFSSVLLIAVSDD